MNKICTSIEQSKKLVKLGINVNTADMFWDTKPKSLEFFPITNSSVNWKIAMDEDGEFPAWSLSALFDLFPNGSILRKSDKGKYFMFGNMFDNPLDAAFEMVCWLKENGKI